MGSAGTKLAVLDERRFAAANTALNAKLKSLKICMAKLDALSPLSVLKRGFSITETEQGEIVREASQVSVGEELKIRLSEGKLTATVQSVD